MEYISMILLAVVLIAQIILFVLYFRDKCYINARFSAMLKYIDRKVCDVDCKDEVEEIIKNAVSGLSERIDGRFEDQDRSTREEIKRFVSEQVKSLMLDYAQAQEAADKVNEFATGLASIFGYDPLVAIKKGRNKEVG